MAKSKKRNTCPCGQAHVLAIFNRASHDELELPVEVHAFATCTDWGAWLDSRPPGYSEQFSAELMSSHVSHFPNWLSAYRLRHMPLDEIDPADPNFLRKLRGEE